MAQKTVKISAGYSDKISENYNSQSYSINLEMDANINGTTTEIEQASERLFQLCRKIVNHQKSFTGDVLLPESPLQQLPAPAPPIHLCSEKQIKCIFGVAKSRGMANNAIQGLAQRFSKQRLEDLTSQEASLLIKDLKS